MDSPDEVVNAVTDQKKIGLGFFALRGRTMAMVPMQELFEREEEEESPGEPWKSRGRGHFHQRRRDHMEQRPADQRPRGESHQWQKNLLDRRFLQK
jgi:hypothetical protein